MPEEKNELRAPRLSPQAVLLAAILGLGGVGGLAGGAKLDAGLTLARETRASIEKLELSVEKLSTSLTELRAKVEANEKLALDARLRALEQLALERRLEKLEAEIEKARK